MSQTVFILGAGACMASSRLQPGISSPFPGRDDCVRNVGNQASYHRPGT